MYKKEEKICNHCNNKFLGTKNSKYCGYSCAKSARKIIIHKTCVECGKDMIVQNWSKDSKYCSISCKAKNQSSEILSVFCTHCNKEFTRKEHLINRNKSGNNFCSKSCADEFNKGSNHYEWKEHLHDKHLSLALKQWSNIIKKRDNYTCQLCGEKGDNRLLQAHHIKHRSTNPELQLNFDNGITLCMKCHALQHVDDDKSHRLIMYKLNSLNLN